MLSETSVKEYSLFILYPVKCEKQRIIRFPQIRTRTGADPQIRNPPVPRTLPPHFRRKVDLNIGNIAF